MPRKRLSNAEVEALMIPKIVAAIYPVLIPVEQQDCRIQEINHAKMVTLARNLWRSYCELAPAGKEVK